MKHINKIKITSARDVQTIIKLNLIVNINNYAEPVKEIRELHLSKNIDMKINETIFIQDFPCCIKDIYTEIKNGHIYKIAIVVFEKQAASEKSCNKQIKEFDKIYYKIVRGLKNNEKPN